MNVGMLAAEYVRNGWAIVPFERGLKGPDTQEKYLRWNERQNCITDPNTAAELDSNIGIAHAYSQSCSIDFDDLERASAWLKERDIDAKELLCAPDAVRISSGRPNRAKLLYRLVTPLPTKAIKSAERKTILEFRCASREGRSVQCVLPPSIHPDTQMPYTWEYGDDLVGDWRHLPEIPVTLLELWRAQISEKTAESSQFGNRERATPEQLRTAVFKWDPNCGYDDWLHVGMVCHYETRGAKSGLDLWDEWSRPGKTYKGRPDLTAHWRSFKSDGDRLLTIASLRIDEPTTVDDFEDRTPGVQVGEVPKALHLCTDQANAGRIMREYDGKLIASTGGRFFAWTGTHWKSDDGEARRFSCGLSDIVRREANAARKKADRAFADLDPELVKAAAEHPRKNALDGTDAGKSAIQLQDAADALEKWGTACESTKVQDSALRMLRDLIKLPESELDKDPWALNCLNGTIDLRTGELREHRPLDYITRLAPVAYDPTAAAPRFEAFIAEIMDGDPALVKFVQRWFGYCATGSVREQKFTVHIGPGGNGKGTLLNAVQDVLGPYSATAAIGLLTAQNGDNRNSAEIAELFGRRMVSAHEPDDNAVLREGFVKQATGGDQLTARWLYRDFFTFSPTHKLQLLTNHRPQIKGSDYGIWRRVLLLPYPVRFGSQEDIAAGKADRLRDNSLSAALLEERKGIFRWLVEGAVAWCSQGLKPPDAVQVAVRDYQKEQDRVAAFIEECCRLEKDTWSPISGTSGLYPRYQAWAKESGYVSLGKGRFLSELERLVPFYSRVERKEGAGDNRRTIRGVVGICLLNAGFEDLM